jgi:hypothetical protein
MKILNKHFINGFFAVINPIGDILEAAEIHPHVITGTGFILSIVSGIMFWTAGWPGKPIPRAVSAPCWIPPSTGIPKSRSIWGWRPFSNRRL